MNSLTDLPDEFHCHRNFYKLIWGELTCKHCGRAGIKFRKNYEYCPHCKRKYSVKADTTLFRGCNLNFRQIFTLIWCWQKKCSIGEIINIIGIAYPTVNRWLERLRKALPECIDVLDEETEVDGSFFGRKKYGKQRLVIGAISPKNNHIRLRIIPKRNREYVEQFIKDSVKAGSTVFTDGFRGYNELPLLGYEWKACDHSVGFFGPTNHIEALWSQIKRALRYIYRDLTFSLKNLELILKEYENRHNNPELFYNVDSYLKSCGCSKFVK